MRLYVTAALVSLMGLADSIYLTVEHVTGRSVRCTIVAGCSEVLSSQYAVVAGVPLALIGAASYFSIFSLATLAAFGYRAAATALTVLVLMMFLVSLWLIYLQAFVFVSPAHTGLLFLKFQVFGKTQDQLFPFHPQKGQLISPVPEKRSRSRR